jgi:hypothetical protein
MFKIDALEKLAMLIKPSVNKIVVFLMFLILVPRQLILALMESIGHMY